MTRRGYLSIGFVFVMLGAPATGAAQDQELPRFPFGTPVVVVPVQSVRPLDTGGWPGGAATEEDALRVMDAELEFALEQKRGASDWALPGEVGRRVDRNPMLRLDPSRMAYQGLLEKPVKRQQIYEPLHSELRAISALFDTRYVILPIALFVEEDEHRGGGAGDPLPADTVTARDSDRPSATDRTHRAHLMIAMIDIRMSSIVWWGEIVGDPSFAGSPALLASLAERFAAQVAPS